MYEVYFGLTRRPFFATPDAGCWFPGQPAKTALAELERCLTAGQGIAVLTAPAGLGKTLICRLLVAQLATQFRPAFLTTGNFTTRRSLLQAILHELAQPYSGMGEQELRIELTNAIQAIAANSGGLLLVIDEAHLLGERLLEELRLLADLSLDGKAPVRVVLSGQPQLEEQLTNPGLEALNQRIGAHVLLETLNRQESMDYILHRMKWAGADDRPIFQPEALELIARAADGVPRCLNQLCDHSLLLGYVGEQTEIDVATVREALGDLQHLPLHWNPSVISELCSSRRLDGDPSSELPPVPVQETTAEPSETSSDFAEGLDESGEECAPDAEFPAAELDEPVMGASFEVGADMDFHPTTELTAELPDPLPDPAIDSLAGTVDSSSVDYWIDRAFELADERWMADLDDQSPISLPAAEPASDDDLTIGSHPHGVLPSEAAPAESLRTLPFESARQQAEHEEVVVDRYAALDAGRDPAQVQALVGSEVPPSILPPASEPPRRTPTQTAIPTFDDISHLRPDVLIERILPLIDESQFWAAETPGYPGNDHPTFDLDSQPQLVAPEGPSGSSPVGMDQEERLGEMVLDLCLEAEQAIEERADELPPPRLRHTLDGTPRVTRFDVVQPESDSPESGYFDIPVHGETPQTPVEPSDRKSSTVPRPNYKLLFSKLRRRQQQERG